MAPMRQRQVRCGGPDATVKFWAALGRWVECQSRFRERQDSGVPARNKPSGLVPLVVSMNLWATRSIFQSPSRLRPNPNVGLAFILFYFIFYKKNRRCAFHGALVFFIYKNMLLLKVYYRF
jgi:hypothetical protein